MSGLRSAACAPQPLVCPGQNVQIDAGLLWAAMAHQRGDDGEIDATIHQMRSEAVPQRAWRHVCRRRPARRDGAADNLADVALRAIAVLRLLGPKQRAALAVLQKIGEQLRVDRFRDRHGTRPIALRLSAPAARGARD